jgi:hypothetical protein
MKFFRVFAVLLFLATVVHADELADAGRTILAKNQNAIVTLKAVLKISGSAGGHSINQEEERVEITGTVVDPSGLTVVSYSLINPAAAAKAQIKRMLARRGSPSTEIDMNSEVTSAKLILGDGTEIPAEIVLRDEDLDLAFFRPTEKPVQPLAAISLAPVGTPQMLDQVFLLNRLSNIAKRTVAVTLGRIDAIVQKPRLFYSIGAAVTGSPLGGPAFTPDGKLVGICLIRKSTSSEDSDVMTGFTPQSGMMPVLLPTGDLTDSIKQALSTPSKPTTK